MRKRLLILLIFAFCLDALRSQSWQDVGGGHNSSSHGMCLYNGTLVDVGSFNNPCNRVASWNGTSWNCFGNGVGLVGRAAIEYNGDLIVVGDFWNVQQPCTGCNGVAKWNGTTWQPLGTGFNNDVLCLTIWNGNLVAGGDFTMADGNPVSRIAMWNGTTWLGIGGATDFDNDIRAMCVYDGELWVGGDFSNVAGCTSCDGLVKWNGTTWEGGDSGVDITGGVDSTVRCLYVDPVNNLLYMGGHFQGLTINGTYNANINGVAVYDGSDWLNLGTGVNSYVRALGEYNGNIIVGGDFTSAGGLTANKIAKWNPSSQTWSAMGTGMNDYVKSLAVYNGDLYVGGPFTMADGQTRNGIAKWYEPPTSPPVASFSTTNNTICPGTCLSFTDNSSNNPTSWNWTFNGSATPTSNLQNPVNICYNNPGTFTVTLQVCNTNGCNSSSQIINVNNITANAGPDQNVCLGSSVNLFGSNANNYNWSPSSSLSCNNCQNPVATPTVNTTYTLTVTGSSGCTATDQMIVGVNPIPNVNAGANDTICSGSNTTLNASGSTGTLLINWQPNFGLSCINCLNPVAAPNTTTNYTVTVTNNFNCSAVDTVTIFVESCLGLSNNKTNKIFAFPIPTIDYVSIRFPIELLGNTCELFDFSGKLIHNFIIKNANEKLNLTEFNEGVYFLKVNQINQPLFIKLVKI
ncbi:MAG: PKD domain-containing protein [Bacteroidota bacterium]|jgi:PKD repeat protein